jgi:hypothetical protein
MNFDLIEKLIRLANNNPNENEANLAARKVCKLLAEGNFKFTNAEPQARTWNDVERSTEPQWKSTPQSPPQYKSAFNPNDYPFADFFKKREKHWDNYGTPPKQEKTAPENPYSWVDPNPPSKQKEERLLKCKKCGNSKLTKFVGLPELYECNTCQWTAYEAKAKK